MIQGQSADSHVRESREDRFRQLEEENKLLLAQLVQVQEQLALQYKQNKIADKSGSAQAHQSQVLVNALGVKGGYNILASVLRPLRKLPLFRSLAHSLDMKMIQASGLFDAKWYAQKYPDVARSGVDPVKHYLAHGAKEGRNPGPAFDTRWYLKTYPDASKSGINPLLHYIRHGRVVEDMSRKLADKSGQIDQMNRELQRSRDAQKQKEEEWQKEKAQLKEAQAHLKQERQVQDGKLAEQSKFAKERQGRIEALKQANAKLEQEKAELSGRLTEQSKLAKEKQGRIEALKQANAKLEEEKIRLISQMQAQKDDGELLVLQIDQVQEELDSGMRQLEERQAETIRLSQSRDEQARLAEERQRQLEVYSQAQTRLEQEKSELSARLADLKQRVEQHESESRESSQRQQIMQEEIVRAEAQIDLIRDMLLRERGQ